MRARSDSDMAAEARGRFELTRPLVVLMALTCGVCVASLYYIQPLETDVAAEFSVTQGAAGLAATCAQVGYALGLLLIVPLGDMLERRALVGRMMLVSAVALVLVACAQSFPALLASLLAVGVVSIVPQLIVPYAAHLAPESERGRVIGDVMSGLLVGILLSRTFSGLLGSVLGWRLVFVAAAALVAALSFAIRWSLPADRGQSRVGYGALLRSLPGLVRRWRPLRESACNGFLMFGAFSAFWTSLSFWLSSPTFGLGPREAGLMGLVGLAGVIAAHFIGGVCDRRGARFSVGVGTVLSSAAFALLFLLGRSVWGLGVGAVVLDLGNQFGQVSNMDRVQSLGDEVRSRTNTVFMFSYFVGGSLGSFLGATAFQSFGWTGVCGVGAAFMALALMTHFVIFRNPAQVTSTTR